MEGGRHIEGEKGEREAHKGRETCYSGRMTSC